MITGLSNITGKFPFHQGPIVLVHDNDVVGRKAEIISSDIDSEGVLWLKLYNGKGSTIVIPSQKCEYQVEVNFPLNSYACFLNEGVSGKIVGYEWDEKQWLILLKVDDSESSYDWKVPEKKCKLSVEMGFPLHSRVSSISMGISGEVIGYKWSEDKWFILLKDETLSPPHIWEFFENDCVLILIKLDDGDSKMLNKNIEEKVATSTENKFNGGEINTWSTKAGEAFKGFKIEPPKNEIVENHYVEEPEQ